MTRCALSNALMELLPGAVIARRREYDWHSANFSGVRLVLDLRFDGLDAVQAINFAKTVGDHDFSLPDLLVADIAAIDGRTANGGIALVVEALLLDEEN